MTNKSNDLPRPYQSCFWIPWRVFEQTRWFQSLFSQQTQRALGNHAFHCYSPDFLINIVSNFCNQPPSAHTSVVCSSFAQIKSAHGEVGSIQGSVNPIMMCTPHPPPGIPIELVHLLFQLFTVLFYPVGVQVWWWYHRCTIQKHNASKRQRDNCSIPRLKSNISPGCPDHWQNGTPAFRCYKDTARLQFSRRSL